jgi:hypothetical protein
VAAFSEQVIARDLLGIEMPEIRLADTVEAVMEREGLPPSVDMKDLESIRQKMAFDAEPAAPASERLEALPALTEAQTTSPLQQASKHRLLAEKRVVRFLHESGLALKITGQDDFHIKIENDPYIPLVVEALNGPEGRSVYLTHYIQQNGDTFHDGEMVFTLRADGHLSFQESAARGPAGEVRGYDSSFAAILANNVIEQGFIEAAIKQLAENSTVECEPPRTDGATAEEAYLDQLFHEHDGNEGAIVEAILDHRKPFPPEAEKNEGHQVEKEPVEPEPRLDHQPKLEQNNTTISPSVEQPPAKAERMVSMERKDFEIAMRAALYIEDTQIIPSFRQDCR